MEMKRNGVTRIVFVFSKFVVKIPNFSVQHSHFLAGSYANWKERMYWKQWRSCPDYPFHNLVVPTLWCSWFGLIQIQARAKILHHEQLLSETDYKLFSDLTTDMKSSNFGYYKGRLVCVDYA